MSLEENVGKESEKSSLYALAVIIDDLKNDEMQNRLNGISKLPTVALAMGPERTRNELLPFIKEATHDEDEILLSIAKQMGDFLTYIGGSSYVEHLLPILETIMGVEETVCRDEAVKSINKIVNNLNCEDVVTHIVPLVIKCAEAEWFTTRSSVCCIFTAVYSKITDTATQEILKGIYQLLCSDETSIVRRVAASKFKDFISVLSGEDIDDAVMRTFRSLLHDDQDSVRVSAVEALPSILRSVSSNPSVKESILEDLNTLFTDRSWRIRFKVCEAITEMQPFLDDSYVERNVVQAYERFFKDDEPEVRTNAAQNLIKFCDYLKPDVCKQTLTENILPCIKELIDDLNVNVKTAIAGVLLKLSKYLDKQTLVDNVIPHFYTMLKDNSPDVKLNVLSNFGDISNVMQTDELSRSLLSTIIELAEDPKWRVRLAVIKFIPSLAIQIGNEVFDSKFTSLCLSWLSDKVHVIREEAGKIIVQLVQIFGIDWAKKFIIPKIIEITENCNYLRRMTALFTFNELLQLKNASEIAPILLPVVLSMVVDRVPNVRFNSAKTLQELSKFFEEKVIETDIKPQLRKLAADPDVDVQIYASRALEIIGYNQEINVSGITA